MLYYPEQTELVLIGSKSGTTRTSATLTNAYGAADTTKAFETGGMPQIVFNFLYTMGAAETTNSVEVRLEHSIDGTNFYQLVNESATDGTSTLTKREFTHVGENASTSAFSIYLDTAYQLMRISVKETGVATNAGSIYVEALTSGK